MRGNTLIVVIFGTLEVKLRSEPMGNPKLVNQAFDCRCYETDDDLESILINDDPDVIITTGDNSRFKKMSQAPFNIRKKWIYVKSLCNACSRVDRAGVAAMHCFMHNALKERPELPLVSVCTPTYNTGSVIHRSFKSLLRQTYKNWEWVIYDDSDDDGSTYSMLKELSETDHRVKVFKPGRHSGIIGEVKHNNMMLASGEIVVEFDHDDEFTTQAFYDIVNAFKKYPEAGFVYSDFAEVFANGQNVSYGKSWAHGYGSYRTGMYEGKEYLIANAPHINPQTIRHIVGAPNHYRAWKKDCYMEIGGHNKKIHIADDYEIVVRTFLNTRMVRVPKLGYIQHRTPVGNLHCNRRSEIQRLVLHFARWYNDAIHQRFVELGIKDYLWDKSPRPEVEEHCSLIL